MFALPEAADWSPGWTADGSVFHGHTVDDFFVQRREGAPAYLGTPAVLRTARATVISADGHVFAGARMATSDDAPPRVRAYVWSTQRQLEDVLDNAEISAVTPDGVAVGCLGGWGSHTEDFVWDRTHGARRLRDVLSNHGVTIPPATNIAVATDISPDGRVIAGIAWEGEKPRYFRAILPAGAFD